MEHPPRRSKQPSSPPERQRDLGSQHQQSQRNQLPQRHGRRRYAKLHGEHGQRRPPPRIHHGVHRGRIQETRHGDHNHESAQGIPAGNKEGNTTGHIEPCYPRGTSTYRRHPSKTFYT